MKKMIGLIALLMLALSLGTMGSADATEESALSRSLKKTHIKTEDATLELTTTLVDAFTPTTVNCPGGSGTCTFRVEVSSALFGSSGGMHIIMQVLIDGSGDGVEPNHAVDVDGGGSQDATFSWMKKGLALGPHTVDVKFALSCCSTSALYRTLTIDVYKP